MELRQRAGCDQVIAERRGEYPRRLSLDGPGPVQRWGRFFVNTLSGFDESLSDQGRVRDLSRQAVAHTSCICAATS